MPSEAMAEGVSLHHLCKPYCRRPPPYPPPQAGEELSAAKFKNNSFLLLQQRISLLLQRLKLFILLRQTIRVALFILGARKRRGLLDQLPDIVAHNGDAILDFRERKRTTVAHYNFPWSMTLPGAVRLHDSIADRLRGTRSLDMRSTD